MTLYEKLIEYGKKDICPMHMPGHKRKMGICAGIDITEIEGFDNLASPKGIIKKMADKAAKLYGADRALLSVNGSTGAILSAILGVCRRGDKIIMARNCHKSVYSAAELLELDTVYVFPDYDEDGIARSISPKAVKKAAEENPDAALIVITSPTYEGVISDIKSICGAAHRYNIPVLVDAAHGAHLKFIGLPDPIDCGADMAAVSLHKTLPAMTQTALLLINGKRADKNRIEEKMNMLRTSSPSYVLMASIGECLEFLENTEEFENYRKRLDNFYKETENLKHFKIKNDNADKGKIVILTGKTDMSGKALMKRFRDEYKIELEMAYDSYALAQTSVCDTDADFERLLNAVVKTDKAAVPGEKNTASYPRPEKAIKFFNDAKTEYVKLSDAKGRICADFIWAYPPGVPIIAAGERIDRETIFYIENLYDTEIEGRRGSDKNKILVIM